MTASSKKSSARRGKTRPSAGSRAARKVQEPAPALKVYPATPSRWPHLESLFGDRGACGGCWCTYWMQTSKAFQKGKERANKRLLERLVLSGSKPGILGYLVGRPVGWCAVGPRSKYPRFERSRVLKAVDDEPVWSITCLFIERGYRKRGISIELVRAATSFAHHRGARIVEAYPVVPSMEKTPDPFVYTGVPSIFVAAGFDEVLRRSKTRPIMRHLG